MNAEVAARNTSVSQTIQLPKKNTKTTKEACITGQWFFVVDSSKELNIQITFNDDSHIT